MKKEIEKTKILIIDDDENFTTVTGAFLENEGYHTLMANTGKEALEKVSSEKPRIVLLDLVLPDAEGTEILKKIRQIDRNVAVITITGYGDEHRAVNVMKAGSCDYLRISSSPSKKPRSGEKCRSLKTCLKDIWPSTAQRSCTQIAFWATCWAIQEKN
jgi:DNA-binding NtrC family response regulator